MLRLNPICYTSADALSFLFGQSDSRSGMCLGRSLAHAAVLQALGGEHHGETILLNVTALSCRPLLHNNMLLK
jgi:hypothetical protein